MTLDEFYKQVCSAQFRLHKKAFGSDWDKLWDSATPESIRDQLWIFAGPIWKAGYPPVPSRTQSIDADIDAIMRWAQESMNADLPRAAASPKVTEHHESIGVASPTIDTDIDDKPDAAGLVKNPRDKAAYRAASKIIADFSNIADSMKTLHRILSQSPSIRRWRPRTNRLSVHLVDWQLYVDRASGPSADGWSDRPSDVEQRKTQIRRNREDE